MATGILAMDRKLASVIRRCYVSAARPHARQDQLGADLASVKVETGRLGLSRTERRPMGDREPMRGMRPQHVSRSSASESG
jgi:hypothetical protein